MSMISEWRRQSNSAGLWQYQTFRHGPLYETASCALCSWSIQNCSVILLNQGVGFLVRAVRWQSGAGLSRTQWRQRRRSCLTLLASVFLRQRYEVLDLLGFFPFRFFLSSPPFFFFFVQFVPELVEVAEDPPPSPTYTHLLKCAKWF